MRVAYSCLSTFVFFFFFFFFFFSFLVLCVCRGWMVRVADGAAAAAALALDCENCGSKVEQARLVSEHLAGLECRWTQLPLDNF